MIGLPMVKMSDEDVQHLRVLILQACLDPNGKTKQELLSPEVLKEYKGKYAPQTIMDVVRGFYRSGYLYLKGETRAALYFLTIPGKEALERFKSQLPEDSEKKE